MSNQSTDLRLKIDAHVIRQLGAELITDSEQALLELIKNSYDADADTCIITIDTTYKEPFGNNFQFGKITIWDNGTGMNREQIINGWLTVSNSEKRGLKKAGKKTKKHKRSYTGDKGLGRLGSMKLANTIRISTYFVPNEEGLEVAFNWDDFTSGTTVDQVKISEKNIKGQKETGTLIDLVGLRELLPWEGQQNTKRLQSKISGLLSPFGHLNDFKVYLKINGKEIDLNVFDEKYKNASVVKLEFKVIDKVLFATGFVKLHFYQGNQTKDKAQYKDYIASDNGKSFFKGLGTKKNLNEYDISYLEDDVYQIKFTHQISWEDILHENEPLSYPGDFEASFYYYFINAKNDVINKNIVKELAGISAFRDGFKMGDGGNNDWIGFSDDKRSGEASYSLRAANTIGYVALSIEHNSNLKEKSDRQGYVHDQYYNGYMLLLRTMLSFSNGFLNRSRRFATEFKRKKDEIESKKPENYSAEDAIVEIQTITNQAEASKKSQAVKSAKTQRAIASAQKATDAILSDMLLDEKSKNEIIRLEQELVNISTSVQEDAIAYNDFLSTLSNHRISAQKIIDRIDNFNDQIDNFHNHVAIGLSAASVAHEIYPQLDNINLNTNKLKSNLKNLEIKDLKLSKSIVSIESDIKIIAKNVSILNPMLRNRIIKKENLSVYDAITDYISFREHRLNVDKVSIHINQPVLDFDVKYSRGKLTQILDNLFRNSIYWLNQKALSEPFNKEISISIDGTSFTIWDNGPGVRTGIEEIIFDIFVTDKSSEFGQGLGLYIVSTLLKQENCSIELLPDRNKNERLYKFRVDLKGMKINE
ncbi:MAG: hypothetical protein COB24_12630 [Hyphomicrobiales bacterium]|nr:MAG: hypothetical protein COB24_12630 [Hyphomicrobiales bacterium]